MKPRLLLVVLVLLCAVATVNARGRFVTTEGRHFVTPDGKPILLKGINLGNWLLAEGYMFGFKQTNSERLIREVINELVGEEAAARFWDEFHRNYITAEDIRFIKRAGFNSIRVPFNYRLFNVADDPQRLEGPGYALLDNVVKWARAEGLYVILDMHAAPGGQTGDNIDDSYGYPFLFESPLKQDLTIRIWRQLARRYQNEPAVLGYDLLNEPIAHFFETARLNPKLEPLYKRIVAGIREVDSNHIILLGGAQWNTNFSALGPPFGPKLAYTFHKYWMEPTEPAIREYIQYSERYQVPIWLGESGENKDEWIAAFRTLLEQADIGWCFWPYKKLDATSSVVSISAPQDWQKIVDYAEGQRSTFEQIRTRRPPVAVSQKALDAFLENTKLKHCRTNEGYLRALGLR